jgi:hypothetical protein
MYTHLYICIYICIYMCVYVYMCIYVYVQIYKRNISLYVYKCKNIRELGLLADKDDQDIYVHMCM